MKRLALWLFWRYAVPDLFPSDGLYAIRIIRGDCQGAYESPTILVSPIAFKERT